jgi:hypothetical protein
MNSANDALSAAVMAATKVVMFFTEDLKPAEYLYRICPKANCTAWIMGHLILSSRGMMTRLGVTDLPPLPDGFEQRFARDATAPHASDYGDISQLRTLFAQHHELFAQAIRKASREVLDKALEKPSPMFGTVGEMTAFAPAHIASHAGQISMIRRSLGREPLV